MTTLTREEAARRLKISRPTLQRRIAELGWNGRPLTAEDLPAIKAAAPAITRPANSGAKPREPESDRVAAILADESLSASEAAEKVNAMAEVKRPWTARTIQRRRAR